MAVGCHKEPCENGGSCIQTSNKEYPFCACRYGYMGVRCEEGRLLRVNAFFTPQCILLCTKSMFLSYNRS
jgi:hypothetical protein